MAGATGAGAIRDPAVRGGALRRRRVDWANVVTVFSAAILIGTEVFGAAYAGGWALSEFFGMRYWLGDYAAWPLQAVFAGGGVVVMAQFIRLATRTEPLTRRE